MCISAWYGFLCLTRKELERTFKYRLESPLWYGWLWKVSSVLFTLLKINWIVWYIKSQIFLCQKREKKFFLCLSIVHLKKSRINQLKHHGDKKSNKNSSIIQMTHEIIMTLYWQYFPSNYTYWFIEHFHRNREFIKIR